MKHPNHDWLAELADREPTAEERKILDEHPEWARELEALREQTEALGALPSLRPPRGDWQSLEARLMSEGLIRTRKNVFMSLPVRAGWTQVAAALLMFVGGAATGLAISGDGATSSGDLTASIETLGDAERAVAASEQQYLNALVRYRELQAAQADLGPLSDSRERQAALDLLLQAGQNALQRAPDDPFINLMFVSTLAEQRATSRRATSSRDNWF